MIEIELEESTADRPIYFFQWLSQSNNLQQYINRFIAQYEEYPDIEIKGSNVHYSGTTLDTQDNQVDVTFIARFKDEFNRRIYLECNNSIEQIDKLIIELIKNGTDIKNTLDWHLKELHSLKKNTSLIFDSYPTFLGSITKLIFHIENKLKVSSTDIDTSVKPSNFIAEIFEFFKGKNNNGKVIMPESEYYRLISTIETMIETESLPQIDKPFPKIAISNDLLKYCFYVLHQELYGTKPQRSYFINFLKDYFPNFENTTIETLKTKFSQAPTTIDKFVPTIVRNSKNKK